MIRWITFAAAVGIVVAAATEITLRLVGLGDPPIAVRDADLEYRLIPDADYRRWGNYISINNHGFRAADHPVDVPEAEARLLLIGDSVVYGNHFLDQEETIALRLSEMLSGPVCTVRVIPMAVSSWGPVNQAAALTRHGSFGATEIAIVLSAHDLVDTPRYSGALIPYRLSKPIGATGDAIEAVIERYFPRTSPKIALTFEERAEASLAALTAIGEQAAAANANFLFVYNATTSERSSGTFELGRRLFDWAKRRGIRILDLGEVPSVTYRDHIHPDAMGATLIAQALAEEYAEKFRCRVG